MKKKAFVRYTKKGEIIPGSLIVINSNEHPQNNGGVWSEIAARVIDPKYSTTTTTTFNFKCYNLIKTTSGFADQDYVDKNNTLQNVSVAGNSSNTFVCASSFPIKYADIQYVVKGSCDTSFGCNPGLTSTTTTTTGRPATTTTTTIPVVFCWLVKNNSANVIATVYFDKFGVQQPLWIQPFVTVSVCGLNVIGLAGLIITKVGPALSDCSNCILPTTTTTTTRMPTTTTIMPSSTTTTVPPSGSTTTTTRIPTTTTTMPG